MDLIHNITRPQHANIHDATAALHFTSCLSGAASAFKGRGGFYRSPIMFVETQDTCSFAGSDALVLRLEPREPRLTALPRLGDGHYWPQKYAPQVQYYRNEHRRAQRVNSYPGQVPLLIFLVDPESQEQRLTKLHRGYDDYLCFL